MRGTDIVCFANDWNGDPLSKKHLMVRLARENRVLWVNSLGCRNPRASTHDVFRVLQKARQFGRGLRRVQPNLWVFDPLAIPFHGSAAARWFNERWLAASLRLACRWLRFRAPIVWSFVPSSADVATVLPRRLLVYHCVDEFSEFTGTNAAAIAAMEAKLASRADVVFVSAGSLLESKRPLNPNTFLVTHGVDVEHFRRALDAATKTPGDLVRGGEPVIGFFGLIEDWVDLDLVRHLALSRPRWSFVLIGKVATDLAPLQGLSNVTVLGRRDYQDLPGYCRAFDAAILPFRINKLTVAANPLKLREYLAAGLPVVATAIPEAERLAPPIRVGRSPRELPGRAGHDPRERQDRPAARDLAVHESGDLGPQGRGGRVGRVASAGQVVRGDRGALPARDRERRAGVRARDRASWIALVSALLALQLLALPSRTAADTRGGPELRSWSTHSLDKVRPQDPRGTSHAVELFAARNEFESFQVVLRSARRVRGIDVETTDLVSHSGLRIPRRHVTVYLQHYLPLRIPSSIEGAAGEWPDALVPQVDAYAGEKRGAFPFELRAERNQPLWIELYVPPGTPPGTYTGALRVTVEGAPRLTVPVRLRVWDFELPSTSTLRTSFGFSGISALEQHRGGYTSDEDLFDMTARYARAALRHRVSIHGGSMVPPRATRKGSRLVVDWESYDREVGPLLEGTLFAAGDPLPGARATSVDLRTPPDLVGEEKLDYWQEWTSHFRQRGWLDRLFVYLWDEPAGSRDYSRVLRLGLQARSADAGLRTLLTEQLVPELDGVVDIWVTLINCIEARPGFAAPCETTVPRRAYGENGDRESLWWYQSCASHGCDIVGGDEFRGWPTYVVDAPAIAQRVMPWMAWLYGVDGELYYNTVEAYALVDDPWRDLHVHGGNGDGTLFYPGTPDRIGGVTDVPVESLRLKVIRDGLEDHEYLTLLDRAGQSDFARRWARTIVQSTYRWQRRPASLHEARLALGEKLSEALGGAPGRSR